VKKKSKKKIKKKSSFFTGILRPILIFASIASILFFIGVTLNLKNKTQCANSISCIKDLTGVYEENAEKGVFLGTNIDVPTWNPQELLASNVLGNNNLEKRIEVDLTTQHLYAFEGDKKVYDFLVSTGKWFPTPTGTFNIWVKLRYTRMSGGNKDWGTYYDLPNVPYVMFYYNNEIPKARGFSLHGAYWHNNFGHPMSHGCVNMRIDDVAKLYYWSNPPVNGNLTYVKEGEGTKIVIYGQAPAE